MNTGIIMIGLSLVILSIALVSSPASAAHPDGDNGLSCRGGIQVQALPSKGITPVAVGTNGTAVLPDATANYEVCVQKMPYKS
jgi:hypothetical protein